MIINSIGTFSETILGIREDNIFGNPSPFLLENDRLTLDETKNLGFTLMNLTYLDNDIGYNYNPELVTYTPDELMKIGLDVTEKLRLSMTPSKVDDYTGYAFIDLV